MPKKTQRKKQEKNSSQLEFALPQPTVTEIVLRVPTGTTLTVGNPTAAPAGVQGIQQAIQTLANAPRESIRNAFLDARLPAGKIIDIATVIHGILYPLAAVGGKVQRRS